MLYLLRLILRFLRLNRLMGGQLTQPAVDSAQQGPGFMGSPDNATALRGVDRAINLSSLYDGTLKGMHFDKAALSNAPLKDAYLVDVSLRDAILRGADLRGAILHGANLRGADLSGAQFNRKTMLPDGSHWTPGADLSRFTDPNHPDFFDVDHAV